MNLIRNPARSRPLSANVRRLMKMEREAPENPDVVKAEKVFTEMDIASCDMQGEIFMAALDRNVDIADFAPLFMKSQIASIIDYSFSRSGNIHKENGEMKADEITSMLNIPLLMKTPDVFADVLLWLENLAEQTSDEASLNVTVMEACSNKSTLSLKSGRTQENDCEACDTETLTEEYEYAYWLGYIYRYECLLHEESSRMVYGAFEEKFMRKMYEQMMNDNGGQNDTTLAECAREICRRLDMLLVGNLQKNK